MSFAIIELGDCRLRDGRQSTCKLQKTHVLRRKTVETAAHFLTRVVARVDRFIQKCPIIPSDILGGRSSSRAKRLRFRDLQKAGGALAAMAPRLLAFHHVRPVLFVRRLWRPP